MARRRATTKQGTVAVINPNVLRLIGKGLRICLYTTRGFIQAQDMLRAKKDLSVFTLRGVHDVAIFHIDREVHSLHLQLGDLMALGIPEDETILTVTEFLKHEGCIPVDLAGAPVPSRSSLEALAALRKDYNTREVPEEEKQMLSEESLILATIVPYRAGTGTQRRTFLMMALTEATPRIMAVFDVDVIEPLLGKTEVLGAYKGESAAGVQYVLDILAGPRRTDKLIGFIHRRAHERLIRVKTMAVDIMDCLVHEVWESLPNPAVGAADTWLLRELKSLGYDVMGIPGRLQAASSFLVNSQAALGRIADEAAREDLWGAVRSFAVAMLRNELPLYVQPFSQLVEWTKERLLTVITAEYGDAAADQKRMQQDLGLKSWKVATFTFGDAVDGYVKFLDRRQGCKLTRTDSATLQDANEIRNTLVHGRMHEIGRVERIEALFSALLDFGLRRLVPLRASSRRRS